MSSLENFSFFSAKSESESASEEKPSDDASPDADKVAEDESAEPKEAEAGSETEEPEKETTTAETTEEEKKDELWTFQFILWSFKNLKHTPIAIVSAIVCLHNITAPFAMGQSDLIANSDNSRRTNISTHVDVKKPTHQIELSTLLVRGTVGLK